MSNAPKFLRGLAARQADAESFVLGPDELLASPRFQGLGGVGKTTAAASVAAAKLRQAMTAGAVMAAGNLQKIESDPRLSEQAKLGDGAALAAEAARGVASALAAARATARAARAALERQAEVRRVQHAAEVLPAADAAEFRSLLRELPPAKRSEMIRDAVLSGGNEPLVAALQHASPALRAVYLAEAEVDAETWDRSVSGWDLSLASDLQVEREFVASLEESAERAGALLGAAGLELRRGAPEDVKLWTEIAHVASGTESEGDAA